jgi:hypothetical protein
METIRQAGDASTDFIYFVAPACHLQPHFPFAVQAFSVQH